jgi:RHS repeat-associated protein
MMYAKARHKGLDITGIARNSVWIEISQPRYKPWGEVRYTTPSQVLPTRYTYTGQYSFVDDDATKLGKVGFGLMFYNARWYDPALGRFAQADTIVPGAGNSQAWDRYSYTLNNPIRYSDPTGHAVADVGGGCEYSAHICKKNYLYGKSQAIVKSMINDKNRDDLEAMADIIDLGATLFKTNDELIPVLSGIFLGTEESNFLTVYNAATGVDKCAAVGRAVGDCGDNAAKGWFGDEGFHQDFSDDQSQPFHLWAYLATAANTEGNGPASYLPGIGVNIVANVFHEIISPDDPAGATWQDLALTVAGSNIGTLVNIGAVPPSQLGNTIRDYIGSNGPGAPWVSPLIFVAPLLGNQQ